MATLYVTEPGVQVHRIGQRLVVRKGDEVLQDIPLIKVDRVVLMGRGVGLTTPALHALAQKQVDVLYLNSRGGFISRMVGREHKHARLRHAQALAVSEPERCLRVARSIVVGKVPNQRVLVLRHVEGAAWAGAALNQMDNMRRQVSSADDLDALRGREGLAAKEYFRILRGLIRPPRDGSSWGFDRRAYYPPPDPVNALLSFGYTLLLNDLVTACQAAGLDPDLGFFHAIDYGRPAMALDLEEEFRPVIVDSLVLAAVNRPLFGLQDFEAGPRQEVDLPEDSAPRQAAAGEKLRPVFLKDAPRKQFIALYEARVNETVMYAPSGESTSYRRIFELQAYAMARAILGETSDYVPFTIR